MSLFKEIWKRIQNMSFTFLFFVSLFVVGFSSFTMYMIESDTFQHPLNAVWWAMTSLVTVGYGDIYPKTMTGKVFTMLFVYPVGIGTIGLFIGKMADMFTYYKRMKEEGKILYKGKGHYVLINWTEKTLDAIEEYMGYQKDIEIVLIAMEEKVPVQHKHIHYIQGDPSDEEILLRGNILEANCVSIFSDDKLSTGEADAKTLAIATAVEGLSEEYKKTVYTVVEVKREQNIKKFKYAKIDEFVLSDNTVSHLMAQASIHKGSSAFFRELVSRKSGENMYEITKQDKWNTYKDACVDLMEQGAILVWDKERGAVNSLFQEVIPKRSILFIICTEEAYQKLTN